MRRQKESSACQKAAQNCLVHKTPLQGMNEYMSRSGNTLGNKDCKAGCLDHEAPIHTLGQIQTEQTNTRATIHPLNLNEVVDSLLGPLNFITPPLPQTVQKQRPEPSIPEDQIVAEYSMKVTLIPEPTDQATEAP